MPTDQIDPTEWVDTFDFTRDTLPEGWGIEYGHFTAGVGVESVFINEDTLLSKRPDLKDWISRLKARFWNRGIMTFTMPQH